MIKIKCAICGKEIVNPNGDQVTCGGECAKKWIKELHKRYRTRYVEAQRELRNRHRNEFLKILHELN